MSLIRRWSVALAVVALCAGLFGCSGSGSGASPRPLSTPVEGYLFAGPAEAIYVRWSAGE